MTCTVLKEKRFLKVVTLKTTFVLPLAQITFKKISYYLSRIFKLVEHTVFSKKENSLVAELESINCIKFPDIFAEVMRVIRH